MTDKEKSLTLNGLTGINVLSILTSIAIIGTCIYLISHYTQTHFPDGLGGESSLCNINDYFTCSHATKSRASNVLGIPVAFFGMMVGFFFLFGSIFPSKEFEKTNSFISKINITGVVLFFGYSLISLGSLCPMCTLFYGLSIIQAFLFYKFGINSYKPDFKILSVLTLIFIGSSAIVWNHYQDKKIKQQIMKDQIINSFNALEEYKNFFLDVLRRVVVMKIEANLSHSNNFFFV